MTERARKREIEREWWKDREREKGRDIGREREGERMGWGVREGDGREREGDIYREGERVGVRSTTMINAKSIMLLMEYDNCNVEKMVNLQMIVLSIECSIREILLW